jgi:hypothetical protein
MKWHFVVGLAAFHLSLASQSPGETGAPPAPPPAPAPAPAQDPAKTTPPAGSPTNRIDQRAEAMRQQIDLGKTVQSHVRVMVRLKNGNRLTGVVKDGRLVERVDGLRFVDASAQEKGAGIRLWYTGGTRNYVFIPFGDFADYEVLQQLSNKQLQGIEDEMQMEDRRAADRAAAARPPAPDTQPAPSTEQAPKPTVKTDDKDKPKTDDAKSDLDQQKAWFGLLQDYPPSAGWCKAKRDEIARRFVVIGAKPSDFEQRFVDKFDDWMQACLHFGVNPEKKPDDGDASGKTGDKSGDKSGDDRSKRKKK